MKSKRFLLPREKVSPLLWRSWEKVFHRPREETGYKPGKPQVSCWESHFCLCLKKTKTKILVKTCQDFSWMWLLYITREILTSLVIINHKCIRGYTTSSTNLKPLFCNQSESVKVDSPDTQNLLAHVFPLFTSLSIVLIGSWSDFFSPCDLIRQFHFS